MNDDVISLAGMFQQSLQSRAVPVLATARVFKPLVQLDSIELKICVLIHTGHADITGRCP